MFCQRCGEKNLVDATVCCGCGERMDQTVPEKPVSFHPDPYAIVFGILIVILMYNLPLIPTKILGLDSIPLTLVEYSAMCSDSPDNLGCFPIVQYLWYGGLIFGICLIVWGLFQRN